MADSDKEPGQVAYEAYYSEIPDRWSKSSAELKSDWAAVEAVVRADETERCAKIAKRLGDFSPLGEYGEGYEAACREIEEAFLRGG